jgi:hypothetical protein
MKIVVLSLAVVFCVAAGRAEKNPVVFPFLDRTACAAVAGDGTAALSGLDALGANPAGLADAPRQWNANYRQLPLSTRLAATAIALPVGRSRWTGAMSYSSLSSEGLEKRDAAGVRGGEFRQEDQTAGLHLGGAVGMGRGSLDLGIGVKFLSSRIDRYGGSGMAFDAGARTRFSEIPLTVSAAVLNWGQGPQLLDERSPLPSSVGLAAAYQPSRSFSVFGGATHFSNGGSFSLSGGAEYFIANVLALRGSYTAGSDSDGNQGLGQLVGGFGVRFGNARLDYAFQPAGEELSDAGVGATQHATLTYEF